MPRYPIVPALKAEIFGTLIECLKDLEEEEADNPGQPLTAGKLVGALWEYEERARLKLTIEFTDEEKEEMSRL